MPDLKASDGTPTGMEYGTLRVLESLQGKYPDEEMVLCLDSARSLRKERDPTYKANRVRPHNPAMTGRMHDLRETCKAVHMWCLEDGLEADDLMFSLSRRPGRHFIYTNDNDLLQAITPEVTVLKTWESQILPWDYDKVWEKYELPPEDLPYLRTMRGDASDNLPGIIGVSHSAAHLIVVQATTTGLPVADELERLLLEGRWNRPTKGRVEQFISSGRLRLNLGLMRLEVRSAEVRPASRNMTMVKSFLDKLEIRSLRICKEVRPELASFGGGDF